MAVNGLINADYSENSDVLKQILTRADDSDTGYLKIWIYVLTGVFSFVCVILLACVIALFVQVNKLSSNLKKIKEERSKDAVGIQDYKISRPRINNGNPNYQRFALPSKQETDSNSDVFFGSSTPSNSNPGMSRNPLSQPPPGLNRQKSFNYEGDPANKNRQAPTHPYQNPTSDYFNISDRSKFTY